MDFLLISGIMFFIFLIILIILIIFVGLMILYYNRLVAGRNRVENAWSQMDVQLKRRNDLIPNLVETVKGYTSHEKSTLENVVQARSNISNATSVQEVAQADNQLTGALKTLFAVAESYPDLKANQNFLDLQDELSQTEDKISYARQFYNDTTLNYNNSCEQFPSNIIAKSLKFEKSEYFKVREEEKSVPKVKF